MKNIKSFESVFQRKEDAIMGFLSGIISAVTGVVETVVTTVATAITAPTIGTVVAAVATVGVVAGVGYLIYKGVSKASDLASGYIESKCNPDDLVQREVYNESGNADSANGPFRLPGYVWEHHPKNTKSAEKEDDYITKNLFDKYTPNREYHYGMSYPAYNNRFVPLKPICRYTDQYGNDIEILEDKKSKKKKKNNNAFDVISGKFKSDKKSKKSIARISEAEFRLKRCGFGKGEFKDASAYLDYKMGTTDNPNIILLKTALNNA